MKPVTTPTALPLAVRMSSVSKVFRMYPSPWSRLLEIACLKRRMCHEEFRALDDVSLEIQRGECLAVLGRNGAGKSTLLKILTGSLFPTAGHLQVNGRVTMLDLSLGLHPELSGRANLIAGGLAMGLEHAVVAANLDAMIAFSELGDFIDRPVKTYSTGMVMRLAFSLYSHLRPEILIIDEAFAVGDARFVLKCTDRIRELRRNGTTIILVTHESNIVAELCDRAVLLDHGRMQLVGAPLAVIEAYHAALGIGEKAALPGVASPTLLDRPSPGSSSGDENVIEQFLAEAIKRPSDSDFHGRDVEILGVRVRSHGAPANGIFRYGEKMSVQWLLDVKTPCLQLTSGIHIYSQLGTYVFGTSYVHLGAPVDASRPGPYLLQIDVDLCLGPGRYLLSVGVAQPDMDNNARLGRQFDRFVQAYEFEVLDFDLPARAPVPFFGMVKLAAAAQPPRYVN